MKLPEELVREVKAHPDGVREVGTEWAIAQSLSLIHILFFVFPFRIGRQRYEIIPFPARHYP